MIDFPDLTVILDMIGLKSFLNFIFLSKRWGTLYLLCFAWAEIYQEFHKVQSVLKSNLGKELEINFPSFPFGYP